MENIRGDIIAPMRKFEKDYDMLIWSNFFGNLKYADQKISFTDCLSFIVMQQKNIQKVFTFDKHFEYAGFRIIPSLYN